MANKEDRSPEAVALGERLQWLRGAVGYPSRRDYCKFLATRTTEDWGVWEDRLEKYEVGETMLPYSLVRLLRKLHEVTYDWILDEEWDRLPNDLFQALKDYQKQVG